MNSSIVSSEPPMADRAWTPQLPLAIHATSALTQDVTFGDKLDLHLTGPSSVALFANPFSGGQVEALIINSEKEIRHLKRTDSGWVLAPLVPGVVTKAKEVVVTVDPDGAVYAHYVKSGGADEDLLVKYILTVGGWLNAGGFNNAFGANLKVIYTSGSPMRSPVVYGLNPRNDRQLLISEWGLDPSGGYFKSRYVTFDDPFPSLAGCDISLYPIAGDTTAAYQCGSYRMFVKPSKDYLLRIYELHGVFFGNSTIEEITLGLLDPPTLSVVTAGALDCTVLTLHLFTHRPLFVGIFKTDKSVVRYSQEVAGVSFNKAAAWFDSEAFMHVYGIDNSGTISVLRQTGWKLEVVSGPTDVAYRTYPTWTNAVLKGAEPARTNVAVPIETAAAMFFVDPHPDSSPTLFVIKKNGDVVLSTQDLLTGRWWTEPVRLAPTATRSPHEIPCYRTQVNLVDASGIPVANYPMRATANSLVQVRVGSVGQLLAPGATVEIMTDAFGRATFCTIADSLTTPSLELSAAGLPNGIVLRPDGPVQDYLAGTGSLPLRKKLSGDVLKDSGVVPSWEGKPTPSQVVTSFQNVFSIAAGAPPPKMAGFVFQTYDSSRPAYAVFETREELNNALQLHSTHPSYGGFFDWLESGFSDLWKGIVAGAVKIVSFAVDVANKAFSLIVRLGDKLIELGRFVIQSFKDAADAVTAVFNQLGAKIDEVVAWLRALFGFKDIWDTKSALEEGLRKFPVFVQTDLLGRYPASKAKAFLNENRMKIIGELDAFSKKFSGKTLEDLTSSTSNPARWLAPETVVLRTSQVSISRGELDGPQANWMWDALLPFGSSVPLGPVSEELKQVWAEFVAAFSTRNYSFDREFKEKFVDLVDLDNPSSLAAVAINGIVDILKWAIDKIFDIVIFLIDALYKLVDKSMHYLHDLTDASVEIPVIVDLVNWIYKQAKINDPNPPQPPKLVLGGLVALIFAFPGTLAWKLATGNANSGPFPGGVLPHARGVSSSDTGPAGEACLLVGGTIQMTYSLLDVVNDVKSTPVTAVAAILAELYMPLLIWPTKEGVPFTFESSEDEWTQFVRWLNWIPGLVYLASDVTCILGASGKKEMAREVEPFGQATLFISGVVNLIFGVLESSTVANVTPAAVCANVLSPLSPAAQVLRLVTGGKPGKALALKLFTNVLSDVGGGAARIAAATGA